MRGEEARVSQCIDVPLRRPTLFGEAICDIHAYFDLHFRTQSVEVAVIVRERRSESVALSYDSRESSAARMEEEMIDVEIIRHETSATTDEFIGHEKTLIETALSAVDTQYEFTQWQKAVEEAVVPESRNVTALRAMSVDSTGYEVSIECVPFYGRITMVEKTVAPSSYANISIHIAEHLVDVDLFSSRAHGMYVETTRKMLRLIGVHLNMWSTRSETIEIGRMLERFSDNEQISVVLSSKPPSTELISAASSLNSLYAELQADYSCMIDISTTRRAANETTIVAHLPAATFVEMEREMTIERTPAEQLLIATVKIFPPPLLDNASANFAYTKVNQWLDSLVVRDISSHTVRKIVRRHCEYLRLEASTLEESTVEIGYQREFVHQTAEIILISYPPPIKAKVEENFAWQEARFSFDSAVIRQTESTIVAKIIRKECDFMRLNATTLEEARLELVMGRKLEEEHIFLTITSHPPPEKAKIMANIAWQETDFSFDSAVDQQIQLNIFVKVVTNAFTSMWLRATTIEDGYFSVLMYRRPAQDEIFVTVIAPAPPLIEKVSACFASQQSEFSFDSSIVREVQCAIVTKIVNKSCVSMSLRATVQEEGEFGIILERRPYQEEALTTLIYRRPPEEAKVMSDFAWQETDFSFDSTVDQHVHSNFRIKLFTKAFTSMRLHATMLEDGEFDILIGRKQQQEDVLVSILAPLSPPLMKVYAGFAWQQAQFFFDSAVIREIQFGVVTKTINTTDTSMSLRAITMEDGEFNAVLERPPNEERVFACLVCRPSPMKTVQRAVFTLYEVSFSFDSAIDRHIKLDLITKTFSRASTSMQLHTTVVEEVEYSSLLHHQLPQGDECVTIVHSSSPTKTKARAELTWQEGDFSLDTAVARGIQLDFAAKSVSSSTISMQLHATTLEEGEFHVAMKGTTEEDEIFVTVVPQPPSMQTCATISEISEHIEFLQTSLEEECGTIVKEIFSDEGLNWLLVAFGFEVGRCMPADIRAQKAL